MADTNPSPNMNLPVPATGVDPGPNWANDLNACLSILDQHTHASGSGIQITPAGLNINSDLTMNSNNLITARSLRFDPQVTPLADPTDIGCLYESGVDLYYNDGNGNQIRITQGAAVAGSTGTITGLPSGTASASFGGGTFTFQRATNTAATIDGASYVMRLNSVSSPALTISPPNSLSGGGYALTLPAIPASQSFLSIDNSGNIAPYVGISSLSGTNMVTNINLPGKAVQVASNDVVVSNTNPVGNGLSIIRGTVLANGTLQSGEGFTSSKLGTGLYLITYTTSFLSTDLPSVVVTPAPATNTKWTATIDGFGIANVIVYTNNPAGALADVDFSFIAIGQRA